MPVLPIDSAELPGVRNVLPIDSDELQDDWNVLQDEWSVLPVVRNVLRGDLPELPIDSDELQAVWKVLPDDPDELRDAAGAVRDDRAGTARRLHEIPCQSATLSHDPAPLFHWLRLDRCGMPARDESATETPDTRTSS